jgi:uncharacterized protein involved in type VI secretion and phage assembly
VSERFHGKHLAVVVDTDDPKKLSRVRVRVPEIFGDEETGWCMPCSPYAGKGIGLAVVPPNGSSVFVEWPAGDTTRAPIWSGALWPDGDGVQGAADDRVLLVTPGGHKIELVDKSGSESVEIKSKSNATVKLDKNGVVVEFGSCKLEVKKSEVSINNGALKVKG